MFGEEITVWMEGSVMLRGEGLTWVVVAASSDPDIVGHELRAIISCVILREKGRMAHTHVLSEFQPDISLYLL